jgi:hypothetical protein
MNTRLPKIPHFVTLPLVVAVMLVTVVGIFALNQGHAAAPEKPQTVKTITVQPEFSFTGTAGWRKGPVNQTSLALFHDSDGCFTSVEHRSGSVDADAEIQKSQTGLAGSGGVSRPLADISLKLATTTGLLPYELHQFDIANTSSTDKLMGGLELGYLQLSGGYIVIQGHCDTSEQLPATIPALEAIRFESD